MKLRPDETYPVSRYTVVYNGSFKDRTESNHVVVLGKLTDSLVLEKHIGKYIYQVQV